MFFLGGKTLQLNTTRLHALVTWNTEIMKQLNILVKLKKSSIFTTMFDKDTQTTLPCLKNSDRELFIKGGQRLRSRLYPVLFVSELIVFSDSTLRITASSISVGDRFSLITRPRRSSLVSSAKHRCLCGGREVAWGQGPYLPPSPHRCSGGHFTRKHSGVGPGSPPFVRRLR